MSAERFCIRTATLNDLPSLHALINSSVRELQRGAYTSAQIEGALDYIFGVDTRLIADQTYFVVHPSEWPDTLVACGGWSFRKTLYGSDNGPARLDGLLDPLTEAAKVRAMFVHPAWARQGLGSLLLEHSEQAARNRGFHRFELGSTLTGVPLYLRGGYSVGESIAVPLQNGESLKIVHMYKKNQGGGSLPEYRSMDRGDQGTATPGTF